MKNTNYTKRAANRTGTCKKRIYHRIAAIATATVLLSSTYGFSFISGAASPAAENVIQITDTKTYEEDTFADTGSVTGDGAGFKIKDGLITITGGGIYKIAGNGETYKGININTRENVKIYLENVKILTDSGKSGISNPNASLSLVLSGDNVITAADNDGSSGGGYGGAGIYIGSTASLTISEAKDKSARLQVTGGAGRTDMLGGAGIGTPGDNKGKTGAITITGGTVTALAGSGAAGIGGGSQANGGKTTITGGSVTAVGSDYGAAIGGGMQGSGGTIKISGGEVTTKGGTLSAAIGGGSAGDSGKISLSGGDIFVYGGSSVGNGVTAGIGIGAGRGGNTGSGNVKISADANVKYLGVASDFGGVRDVTAATDVEDLDADLYYGAARETEAQTSYYEAPVVESEPYYEISTLGVETESSYYITEPGPAVARDANYYGSQNLPEVATEAGQLNLTADDALAILNGMSNLATDSGGPTLTADDALGLVGNIAAAAKENPDAPSSDDGLIGNPYSGITLNAPATEAGTLAPLSGAGEPGETAALSNAAASAVLSDSATIAARASDSYSKTGVSFPALLALGLAVGLVMMFSSLLANPIRENIASRPRRRELKRSLLEADRRARERATAEMNEKLARLAQRENSQSSQNSEAANITVNADATADTTADENEYGDVNDASDVMSRESDVEDTEVAESEETDGGIPEVSCIKGVGTVLYTVGNGACTALYVNLTNKCTNDCTFCVRQNSRGIGSASSLWLRREPTAKDVIKLMSLKDLTRYSEIVFCGYGEPFCAFDTMKTVCLYLKERRGNERIPTVRINTNGQGELIYSSNLYEDLKRMEVGTISVSLNAPTSEEYNKLCRPRSPDAYTHMLEFTRKVKDYVPNVTLSVVNVMPGDKLDECKSVAGSIGTPLRVRAVI